MNVKEIQKTIDKYNCDGLLISNFDKFFSEYVSDEDNQLKRILGFSGSNGIGVIENSTIHIFTDGRYETQAKKEVSDAIIHIAPKESFSDWLNQQVIQNKRFAFDPHLFRYITLSKISSQNLIPCGKELIDEIIATKNAIMNRKIEAFILDDEYTGETAKSKIEKLDKWFTEQEADNFLIEDCDSIAWLLNLRSNYYEFNPTIPAKLLFSRNQIILFVEELKVFENISRYLSALDVIIKVLDELNEMLDDVSKGKVMCENSSSYFVKNRSNFIVNSPLLEWKSNKNKQEIYSARNAHIEDAKAITNFMTWFKKEFESKRYYTEYELSQKLISFRKKQPSYFSESFPAIIGFQEHGSVIHYRPLANKSKLVKGNGLLLIDSGGQYFGGTTDVTRTYAIGEISEEQKKTYTLVLKGHIAAASKIFDNNITGAELDKLARQYLVAEGLDYQHGTGHGVGSFLNVHEGPYSISRYSKLPLKENLIFSIEPGYYKEGEYGIRLENLYLTKSLSDNKLYFEPLTLIAFEDELIDFNMLTPEEKSWLDDYNKKVGITQ